MLKTRLMLVLLAIGMSALLTCMPAAEDEKPSAEKLIEQLSSEEFARRERAALLLQARGAAVLPALRKARNHRDAEVRRRVREMIPFLETAAVLEPKRVTLGSEPRTLSAILKDIEKQTGYQVELDGNDDGTRHAFEMKSVLFWEALERIGRQTDRAVSIPRGEKGIRLARRAARSPFVAVRGSFRLEVTKFHEDRDIDFTESGKGKEAGQRSHRLTLTILILAEPRFIILDGGGARVQTATDEDGKSLAMSIPAEQSGRPYTYLEELARRHFEWIAEVLLQRASEKARRIKVLRGSIPIEVVVERERVVFTENVLKARGVKCRVREGSLEIITAVKRENGDLDIRIEVPSEPAGVRWQWHDRVHLEDSKGNPYKEPGRGTMTSLGKHEILLTYPTSKDPKVGPPSKLIVEDWTTLHYAIPFEFKDVPLP